MKRRPLRGKINPDCKKFKKKTQVPNYKFQLNWTSLGFPEVLGEKRVCQIAAELTLRIQNFMIRPFLTFLQSSAEIMRLLVEYCSPLPSLKYNVGLRFLPGF